MWAVARRSRSVCAAPRLLYSPNHGKTHAHEPWRWLNKPVTRQGTCQSTKNEGTIALAHLVSCSTGSVPSQPSCWLIWPPPGLISMRFASVRGCTAAEVRLEPTNRAEQPLTRTVQPTHILDRSIARKKRGVGPFGGRSHLENHPNECISTHVLHGRLLPSTPPTGAFHARWRAEEATAARIEEKGWMEVA